MMRGFLLIWLILMLFVADSSGQEKVRNTRDECESDSKSASCLELVPVQLEDLTIELPRFVRLESMPTIDLPAWVYADKTVHVSLYRGRRTPMPGLLERELASYAEKKEWVDQVLTLIWQYEDEKVPLRYVRAARYFVDGGAGRDSMTVLIRSSDEKLIEQAPQIFSSVRFNIK